MGTERQRFVSLFLGGSNGKESACQCKRPKFSPWVGKIPWRREWLTTPVFLPGESHGQRKGVWWATVHGGLIESDMTEQLLLPKSEKAWDLF